MTRSRRETKNSYEGRIAVVLHQNLSIEYLASVLSYKKVLKLCVLQEFVFSTQIAPVITIFVLDTSWKRTR